MNPGFFTFAQNNEIMEDFNNAQDATLNTVEESPKKSQKYRIILMREGFEKKCRPKG